VHDRRLEGETLVFGNAIGLYLGAMTLWDHATSSIWSQPVGEAIAGARNGEKLALLPSQVTTWANWRAAYSLSFVMTTGLDRAGVSRQAFDPDFVIGLVLGEHARAYRYEAVAGAGLVQDQIAGAPVLVWAAEGDFRVYLRLVGEQELNFKQREGQIVDTETGSVWDIRLGLALEGELAGQALVSLPALTAYDWAFRDFYPGAEILDEGDFQ